MFPIKSSLAIALTVNKPNYEQFRLGRTWFIGIIWHSRAQRISAFTVSSLMINKLMGDCFTADSLTGGSFSSSVWQGGTNCILYWFLAKNFKECFFFLLAWISRDETSKPPTNIFVVQALWYALFSLFETFLLQSH